MSRSHIPILGKTGGLSQADQRHLAAAAGYLELGMAEEASMELEAIAPENRAWPEVLRMRVALYRFLERWEVMAEIAKHLASVQLQEAS